VVAHGVSDEVLDAVSPALQLDEAQRETRAELSLVEAGTTN